MLLRSFIHFVAFSLLISSASAQSAVWKVSKGESIFISGGPAICSGLKTTHYRQNLTWLMKNLTN